jgi:hypothetical protein
MRYFVVPFARSVLASVTDHHSAGVVCKSKNKRFFLFTLHYYRIVGIARGRPCCVGRVKETVL